MNLERVEALRRQGEGIAVEFKLSRGSVSGSVFETVCAFLNRSGGELLLGVADDGKVVGIDPDKLDAIRRDFATTINNPQKLSPPCYLSLQTVHVGQRDVLYLHVPASSQVHRCKGRIFDRNEDGDFDVTDTHALVSAMYVRKQASFSENTIYPYARLPDLRSDVIDRVRKLAARRQGDHPWVDLGDMELLKSAQLYLRDFRTGEQGITLAGILLFGRHETILSLLPAFKTDAILRRENVDRYDDRDDIRTNLIDSYDRLVDFGEKHLNDPFYLEGDQRVSLRGRILREVVANLLIHREFTSAFPAKLVIERGRFFTENSNRPHGHGLIDPQHFSPFPKNPTIARVFKEIGRADELGSGVRNLFRYCRTYAGHDPQLIEEDIFRFVLPISKRTVYGEWSDSVAASTAARQDDDVAPQATPQATPQADAVLSYCAEARTRQEIQRVIGVKDRKHFRRNVLQPLLDAGLLRPTIPGKPTSPKQRYVAVRPEEERG